MKKKHLSICIVMLTRNRPQMCRETATSAAHALNGLQGSILIINNGNTPVDMPGQISSTRITVIKNSRNLGTSARNQALSSADLLLMLDDDAIITPRSIRKAVQVMTADESIGAVAFRISDNSGGEEACLLPTVFHGCACCFRSEALAKTGGYPNWHNYYGEEYPVAFNLYSAGYRICMLTPKNDVTHLRHPGGRDLNRIIQLNVLHNITVWTSYFPFKYLRSAITDTIKRYYLVAKKEKAMRGIKVAIAMSPIAILKGLCRRKPMSLEQFRHITMLDRFSQMGSIAASKNINSIIMAGTGKFPSLYIAEFRKHGLDIAYILDTNPCWRNASICNIPVFNPENDGIDAPGLMGATTPSALITGTASIPESLFWREAARLRGMIPVWQDGWARNAEMGIVDLLENQPTAIMSEPHHACK
jgi:GT2 family glycosyltransferase